MTNEQEKPSLTSFDIRHQAFLDAIAGIITVDRYIAITHENPIHLASNSRTKLIITREEGGLRLEANGKPIKLRKRTG